MGVKFVEVISSHDVEDQPAGEVAVWFNSVTDCFIMTQTDDEGATEQICIYPRQMHELRDLLNRALEEDTPEQFYTCKGKGGRYLKLGEATGAGTSRDEGNDIVIYQDVYTGQLFKRTVGDFYTRMEKIDD